MDAMSNQHEAAQQQPSDNLPTAAAAKVLGVPPGTLAQWRSSGRVPLPYLKLGGVIRYRRSDLEAFLAANLRGGAR
jgi:excisionase family DNA binding protein